MENKYKYIYGPVHSRRIGLSLGVSLTPRKVCSFDCIYCQLGKSLTTTAKRKEYVNIGHILAELREAMGSLKEKLDYITFSGFGEPTLNVHISHLVQEIRKIADMPIALITNASLFNDEKVRKQLLGFDLVVPSLDAVTQDIFEQIDRPVKGIEIEGIIFGLIAFRKEFKGKIFLEIMLIKDINDSLEYAVKFKQAADKIQPDKIQLNTPVRSVVENYAIAPDRERLLQIKEILGNKCEIV